MTDAPDTPHRSPDPGRERADAEPVAGELVSGPGSPSGAHGPRGEHHGVEEPEVDAESMQSVTEPAKVMRIGSMVKQLLEEVRMTELDQASRERLAEVYERSITELGSSLSPDLQTELTHLALPLRDDGPPSEAELRVAKAQLVGWLEGLFHGIQATLFAQQLAARQQLEQMRQLPQGGPQQSPPARPGTYL